MQFQRLLQDFTELSSEKSTNDSHFARLLCSSRITDFLSDCELDKNTPAKLVRQILLPSEPSELEDMLNPPLTIGNAAYAHNKKHPIWVFLFRNSYLLSDVS